MRAAMMSGVEPGSTSETHQIRGVAVRDSRRYAGIFVWSWMSAHAGTIGGLGGAGSYVLAFTAWGQWFVFARVWLPLTGRLPWDLVAFLEDAYHRGVLRQTGAVYQFRHLRLQHHLGSAFRRHDAAFAPVTLPSPRTGAGAS